MQCEVWTQGNCSASFQECENSMGSSPESQGQRVAFCCVSFPHCADAALFLISRGNLGPDATQTGICSILLTEGHWTLRLDWG